VTNTGSDTVSVIRTSDNTVIATIPVATFPAGIAITPNGNFAYVTIAKVAGEVSVINTTTNTVVGPPIVVGNLPDGIAITPNGAFAYVANYAGSNVSVINTSSNTAVATIPVQTNPLAVAITPNGNFAYVANWLSDTVSVIHTPSNTVVATIPVGDGPGALAITPIGNFVYVTNQHDGTVSVIRTSNNTVIATIPVGNDPEGIAITPDGNFAYVTNYVDNNVSVINTATNTVVGPAISVGTGPLGIAFLSSIIPPPIPLIPAPPTNLTGHQKKNDFGTVFEYFNLLKWEASPSSIAGYVIYRDGKKIANLNASALGYEDHNRKKDRSFLYSVAAVDANGSESSFINVEVK